MPLLVLVAGLGGTEESVRGAFAPLLRKLGENWRVVALAPKEEHSVCGFHERAWFDYSGCSQYLAPSTEDERVRAQITADLIALKTLVDREAKHDWVVILGHSMGGMLASHAALTLGDRRVRLVVASHACYVRAPKLFRAAYIPRIVFTTHDRDPLITRALVEGGLKLYKQDARESERAFRVMFPSREGCAHKDRCADEKPAGGFHYPTLCELDFLFEELADVRKGMQEDPMAVVGERTVPATVAGLGAEYAGSIGSHV